MTVCIAALADDNKSLVLASDKEVTFGPPINTEVENDTQKIQKITDKIYVLLAGNSLIAMQLIEDLRRNKQGATTVKEVAEALRDAYVIARQNTMEEVYLKPRGLTLERFIKEQKDLNQQLVLALDNSVATDNQSFGVAFIVAGIDNADGNAYIYGIFHPGTMSLMNVTGFCTIGIGDVHAMNSFIGNRYSTKFSLREALYYVYEAKKKSEVAPGVGQMTDIITLTSEEMHELTDTEIKELDKIRNSITENLTKELEKELNSYKLAGKTLAAEEKANGTKPETK